MRSRMALMVALALAAVAGFGLLVAGAGGFFSADAQPEAAPVAAPGDLVQFVTATPAPSGRASSAEPPPVFADEDDDRWEEEHERAERAGREDDDHDEHEADEEGEWEHEDDD